MQLSKEGGTSRERQRRAWLAGPPRPSFLRACHPTCSSYSSRSLRAFGQATYAVSRKKTGMLPPHPYGRFCIYLYSIHLRGGDRALRCAANTLATAESGSYSTLRSLAGGWHAVPRGPVSRRPAPPHGVTRPRAVGGMPSRCQQRTRHVFRDKAHMPALGFAE